VSQPVEATVAVLLEAAGLKVSDAEFDAFVAAYPAQRAALDMLFEAPMVKEEEPQTVFSPFS
jgi:hypothetical protein